MSGTIPGVMTKVSNRQPEVTLLQARLYKIRKVAEIETENK